MLRVVAALLLLLASVSVEAQTRNPPAQSLGPNSTAYGAINCAPGKVCDLSQMTVTPQGGSAAVLPLLLKNYLSVDGSGALKVLNGPTLGTYQNGKFTSQPNAIQIQGSGSTGDVSGMSVTPSAAAAAGTLARIANDKADLTDTSSVIGNAAKHFSQPFYGNPATGTEPFRRNRIFCGAATASGGGIPASPRAWPDNFFGDLIASSQLACVSAIGLPAIVGVTRTSDFRAWAGSTSGGPPGVGGFTINDDTTGAPIATALYGESLHNAGVGGVTEAAELTVSSAAPTVPLTPYGGIVGGTTFSLNLTAGFRAGYKNNVSAAAVIGGSRDTVAKQQRGIVVLATALDPALGRGGNGVAWELAQGQSIRWLGPDNSVKGEIYAGPNGLAIGPNQIEGAWAAFTPTVRTSGGTVITGVTTDCATIRIGRTVQARYSITLPASSFGDGSVVVTTPSQPRNTPVWLGRSPSLTGPFQAVVSANGSSINLLSMTDAGIGAASRTFNFSGTYEAAAD